ncbi:uncharacterized protein LOC115439819 [Manduca sexta]|uniref:uncharacterized protein LOC115439819 n=1 Tax=Manduca sexta TaxID=7130 RepID=UPI00188FAFB1|nr:uncharacterized protein LOC115439819 [Manduca sexta]
MNIVILFCFVFVISAFANQVTVPVQLYPAYQQSVYNSPAAPVVYQTAPTSYNNPCAQYTIAQNTLPNQLVNNLVSKVLANPTIHRILDPNTRFYNQNGEIYNQQPIYNREVVPNIINNYFIVPPEFLKLNQSDLNTLSALPNIINNEAVHKIVDNVEILTNIPQVNYATKENLVQVSSDASQTAKTNQQTTRRRKTRRKKGKKRARNKFLTPQSIAKAIGSYIATSNTQNIQENQEKSNVTNKILNSTQMQNNGDVVLESKDTTTETTNQNSSNSNTDGGHKKKSKKRPKSDTNAASIPNTGEISQDNIENNRVLVDNDSQHKLETDKIMATDFIQGLNINNDRACPDSSPKELNEECFEDIGSLISCLSDDILDSRITRNSQSNSRDEAIWRDFRQSFPDVPENLARSMLMFAQNQYQNPQNSNFYYPTVPFGFDQIYQMPHIYNYGKGYLRENIPKSKNRRHKSKKRKAKNKKRKSASKKSTSQFSDLELLDTAAEDYSELTSTTMENLVTDVISSTDNLGFQTEEVPSDIPTTNLPIDAEVLLRTISPTTEESPSDYDNDKHLDSHERYEELDLGYRETPELGEEDTVPIIYTNGLIDDYYPTFTDNAYYANDHEYTVADLNERYYYTTDRNVENFGRDRRKLESLKEAVPKILQKSFRDAVPKHTYFDADRESYKNLIKEKFLPKSQFKPTVPPVVAKESFKTPPALENPDFKTKRINKDPLDTEDYKIEDSFDDVAAYFDYAEKSSIYSNAKTPFYNGKGKPNSETGFVLEKHQNSMKVRWKHYLPGLR